MDAEFGRYRLLGLIGEGGMGKVFKAHDTAIDRDVAIKVLPTDLAKEPGYRERFRREARIAARLNEPHIIPIYDTGEIDGHLYLVMPVVDGVDAHGLLQRDGAMLPQRAVRVIEQLAAALDAAHSQGLVHRDVKPSNALVTPRDFVYLIDFGIAHDTAATKLTSTGTIVGTLAYMAPERFTTGIADDRSDIYALACVLYECLTGDQPYPGNSVEQQIAGHLSLDPPQPSIHRPAVPVGFDEVIARGMAKAPDLRYQSAGDLAIAARAALHTPLQDPAARTSGRSQIATLPANLVVKTVNPSSIAETQVAIASASEAQSTQSGQVSDLSDQISTDRPVEVLPQKRPRRKRILVVAAMAMAVLTVIGVTYAFRPIDNTASTPADSPAPPAAVLDGTYRIVFSPDRTTLNGKLNPPQDPPQQADLTTWWAFRSVCSSDGCTATATALDKTNHELANPSGLTEELRFIDGHWLSTPVTDRVPRSQCYYDYDQPAPGNDTISGQLSLEPQPDGTLRGSLTQTVITSECNLQGGVTKVPISATRVGDVPGGVPIADPAIVQKITTPAIGPIKGPSLAGTYRLDFNGAEVKVNGVPTPQTANPIHWWAFESLCTAAGCVATAATLDDSNHQVAGGTSDVFHFADGKWQNTPDFVRTHCNYGPHGGEEVTVKGTMELQPQPDGTIRGMSSLTRITNECGDQGQVEEFPFIATRTGDVPPSVVLADPALYAS